MEKKARIIVYDDVGILDESDTLFEDKEQLAGIAKQNLSQTPDAELADLQRQLEEHGISDIAQDKRLSDMVENYINTLRQDEDEQLPLGGEPAPLDDIFATEGMPASTVPLEGDITEFPPIEPAPEYERKVILECPVAGIGFHDINDIWD